MPAFVADAADLVPETTKTAGSPVATLGSMVAPECMLDESERGALKVAESVNQIETFWDEWTVSRVQVVLINRLVTVVVFVVGVVQTRRSATWRTASKPNIDKQCGLRHTGMMCIKIDDDCCTCASQRVFNFPRFK